ncbi:MAG: twin-arginine translocase subunit TatC [Ardenticatenaceae bacterium]|nr:twin-arginine translocase subunit TatC [Anaerolineales bacterium]MCB8920092.1 twin-arginine translocase subunit TatC [Ardenticatenaceae bacterium]
MSKSKQQITATETLDEEAEMLEMSLLEHLNDLRKRGTWAVGILLAATIISFIFAEPLLNFLLVPYAKSAAEGAQLQTIRPTEGIETFFKVSLLSGAILSMPFILLQFWLFISPGLTKSERRYVYVFIPSALLLFAIGIAFAWYILVPASVFFLANFLPDVFRADWQGQEYIGFLITMLFWVGVSFEMPVIAYFVARVGLVTAKALREQWRIAIVGIAVLAAAITPSIDPVTMLLTMSPLLVLYVMSIGSAVIGQRQFERSMAIE